LEGEAILLDLFGVHVSIAALLLRVTIGAVFIVHGYPKFSATQRKQGGDWMKNMGLPAGFILLGAVVEFFGGIAILLGILTQCVAGLFALWMLSTTWLAKVKMKKKFAGGYEIDIVLLLASLALAAIAGGSLSIDHLLGI
jgi:putative oxidoreductase